MEKETEQVNQFLSRLEHPFKEGIELVRAVILNSNEHITEHIKWNAPSFCYKGEDRVTFNLHTRDRIQLIFHQGAKASESAVINLDGATDLIQWITGDRAKVEFNSLQDVEKSKAELAHLVNTWVENASH